MSQPLLMALLAGLGAAVLALLAALLLGREARERDIAGRIRRIRRNDLPARLLPARSMLDNLAPLRGLGERLRRQALFSRADITELEQSLAAAGIGAQGFVAVFLATKVMLLVLAPAAAAGFALLQDGDLQTVLFAAAGGLVAAVLIPNLIVRGVRGPHLKALRRGLPDALDLMVVCAEAGLGLDSAVERVAVEIRASNPAVGVEFATLGQELRLLPSRHEALQRLGDRSGIEGFRRLAATLSQTLHYGTPLSQALRMLAADMRQERMTLMEENAARLPALMVLPLILFIMPCLFIVLIGPSMIQLMASLGGM